MEEKRKKANDGGETNTEAANLKHFDRASSFAGCTRIWFEKKNLSLPKHC